MAARETTAGEASFLHRELEAFLTQRNCCNDDSSVSSCPRRPATSLQDCIVGPSKQEREMAGESWRFQASPVSGTKRKRDQGTRNCSLEEAISVFLSSGCCIVPDVLPRSFVETCGLRAAGDFDKVSKEVESKRLQESSGNNNPHELAAALRVDFQEVVDRDGNRRDVRMDQNSFPYNACGLIYNSMIFPLVKELLGGGDDVNLLYVGVMWARSTTATTNNCSVDENAPTCSSSASHQKWHADGDHLFRHSHQPPHCINVFYPLIDLTRQHGPTEVKPGSHILGSFSDPSLPTVPLTCRAGDAILFDYRLKHRGSLNVSKDHRAIMYICYGKPWYRDSGNTRSRQSLFPESRPWTSRILSGRAMPMMHGFEDFYGRTSGDAGDRVVPSGDKEKQHLGLVSAASSTTPEAGSGEQWILFKLNVQLPGRGTEEEEEENNQEATIVIRAGDVPVEVAAQFCLQHQLQNDFIPILAQTIQEQMSQVGKG